MGMIISRMILGRRSRRGVAALACVVAFGLASASDARADLLTYSDNVPLTSTNWADSLTFPQFDPALGTLNSIELSLDVVVDGTVMFESLDFAPTDITASIAANVMLQRPDTSVLLTVATGSTQTDAVTAYDGLLDFGGDSGRTYSLGGSNGGVEPLSGAGDLALFTGMSAIDLPIFASAISSAGGAGNLVALLSTSASAAGSVTYNYTPIPAPPAVLLGAMGLGIAGRLRRRYQ